MKYSTKFIAVSLLSAGLLSGCGGGGGGASIGNSASTPPVSVDPFAPAPPVTNITSYVGKDEPTGWDFWNGRTDAEMKPWSFRLVNGPNDPIRYGYQAERFEVRNGDCLGTDCTREDGARDRNERNTLGIQQYDGDTYWYGWSFYVAPDWQESGNNPITSGEVTMAQFMQVPKTSATSFNPVFMFGKGYSKEFNLRMFPTVGTHSKTFSLIRNNLFKGRWHDIVMQVKWTTKEDGFFRVWVNDRLMVEQTNLFTMFPTTDFIVFHHGLYRPATPNMPITSVAFFDELRRGKTREEVDIRIIEKIIK